MALQPGDIQYSPRFVVYVVSCFSINFGKVQKREFSQCKELVSPSKKRLENRATSQEEGEDLAGPSSAEDTVSNILYRDYRFEEKYRTVADHAHYY